MKVGIDLGIAEERLKEFCLDHSLPTMAGDGGCKDFIVGCPATCREQPEPVIWVRKLVKCAAAPRTGEEPCQE